MNLALHSRDFELFGISHLAALAVVLLMACGLCRLMCSGVQEKWKDRTRLGLAVVLFLSVLADPLLAWRRYAYDPQMALEYIVAYSLPFYLCDVVAVILGVALLQKNQRLAEIGYLWGIAGTVQGLITPTLYFDWRTPEFYAFFAQHGGVPVAAMVLVVGMGLKPEPGVFKRALFSSWAYMAIIYAFNGMLRTNYGFLNEKPSVSTLFDFMGPWPYYLITLQIIAFSLYALLLLPFRGRNERRQSK